MFIKKIALIGCIFFIGSYVLFAHPSANTICPNNKTAHSYKVNNKDSLSTQNPIYSVKIIPVQLPVGKGATKQKIISIEVETSKPNISLQQLSFNLSGTTSINDINNIQLFYNKNNYRFDVDRFASDAVLIQSFSKPNTISGELIFNGTHTLATTGKHYYFIVYSISAKATEGNTVGGNVNYITINNQTTHFAYNPASRNIVLKNKLLFSPKDLGSASYRIPSLLTTKKGVIIAAVDKRNTNSADLYPNNNIDIVVKRSTDNGKTWSNTIYVYGNNTNTSMSDPSLIEAANGHIILLSNMGNSLFKSVAYEPANPNASIRPVMCQSTDGGLTWSTPTDLAAVCYNSIANAVGMFISSGNLLRISKGKYAGRIMGVLVVKYNNSNSLGNHILYSDDHGSTWQVSANNATPSGGDEAKVVELNDGSILLSSRKNSHRLFNKSTDGGITWGNAYVQNNIVAPACNGDMIRYTSTLNGSNKNRLLHSVPWANNRSNVSIALSYDEGNTWGTQRSIFSGSSAYSALSILPNNTIGIFWECGEQNNHIYDMYFTQVSLPWLTQKADDIVLPKNKEVKRKK